MLGNKRILHSVSKNHLLAVNKILLGSSKRNYNNSKRLERVEYNKRLNRYNVFVVVPHAEQWIVERLGKYNKTLESGLHFLFPFLDRVAFKHMKKEIPVEISEQTAITKDNVQITIDGVLYYKIQDPYKASYEIDDPAYAIMNLAQTTMRAEIGRITLDKTFSERQSLNASIVSAISRACEGWGVSVERYEIKDIRVPTQIRNAMDLEAEAERKKRKVILDSEAERQSQENIAQGRKRATELISEADMVEQKNAALGEAFAIVQKATASAQAIHMIASAINSPGGEKAVTYKLAEEYIKQFGKLAQQTNTVIIPANVNDASSVVTQAVTIFDKLSNKGDKASTSFSKQEALEQLVSHLYKDPSMLELIKKQQGAGEQAQIVEPTEQQQQ